MFSCTRFATGDRRRSGALCAPAKPNFDQEDFDNLIDATYFSRDNWAQPAVGGTSAALAPHAESAVIETLSSYFVRVLRSVTAQLCYGKDAAGRWTIAGFVGDAD